MPGRTNVESMSTAIFTGPANEGPAIHALIAQNVAERGVVEHQRDEGDAVLGGRGQLLHRKQETAVARHRDELDR